MTIYHAAAQNSLWIVPLDELTAVYHRPAGATHLLAEPAPEILTALQDGPADLATVIERLRLRFEVDPAAATAIATRLDELIETGLVRTA